MPECDTPVLFKQHTAVGLQEQLAHLGVDLRLARRVQAAVLQRRGTVPEQMPEVSPRRLAAIRASTVIPRLTLVEKQTSTIDGFTKYLFTGDGGEPFESVGIPLVHRPGQEKFIVCVSSQVGCAMGCAFCATAKLGFRRNLAAWEIVDQVVQVQEHSPHPVRGVVFMGMGEPLHNYDAVMRAAEIMSEPCGLGINARAITISTVGIVPQIRRYTAERRPYRLIVSLTSADPEVRRRLLPVEKAYPLAELMAAVREYQQATGERVTLAMTALGGINTRTEDARLLAELTAGMPVRINLIDVNDPSGVFQRATLEELDVFRAALNEERGIPVVRRYSGGQDVHGGCGMLAGLRADSPNDTSNT